MQNRPPKHMHRAQDMIIRENPATSLTQAECRNIFFSTFYFQKQTHAWWGGMRLAWDGGAGSQPCNRHIPLGKQGLAPGGVAKRIVDPQEPPGFYYTIKHRD